MAVDSEGNLFFVDEGNYRIRKITTAGIISTIAGNGISGNSGDGGPATEAQIYPYAIAVDRLGNLFIAEKYNHRIRKVDVAGVISTVAGIGTSGFSGDGGLATAAKLNYPSGVAIDYAGNIIISDTYNNRIRKIAAGIISTIAGNGISGFSGDEGPATEAMLNNPEDLTVDSADNIYIADVLNSRIRKVTFNIMSTVGGNGQSGFSNDGGSSTQAALGYPIDMSIDSAGDLYIVDYDNDRIRRISNNIINTVAGNGSSGFSGDGGAATEALLNQAWGIAVDFAGNVYIADTGNCRIRKVANDGVITTIAGNGNCGFSGDGGPATTAMLNAPRGVAVDSAGNVIVSDTSNNRIRKITAGVINTIAGDGTANFGGDEGQATEAKLNYPRRAVIDRADNIYVADSGNNRIRKITPAGIISTIAGNGEYGWDTDYQTEVRQFPLHFHIPST
jgi:sugar lactone lactonase YvrE